MIEMQTTFFLIWYPAVVCTFSHVNMWKLNKANFSAVIVTDDQRTYSNIFIPSLHPRKWSGFTVIWIVLKTTGKLLQAMCPLTISLWTAFSVSASNLKSRMCFKTQAQGWYIFWSCEFCHCCKLVFILQFDLLNLAVSMLCLVSIEAHLSSVVVLSIKGQSIEIV